VTFKGKFKEKVIDLVRKYILFSTYEELAVVLLIKHKITKKEIDKELLGLKIKDNPEEAFFMLKRAIQIEYLEYGSDQFDSIKINHLKLWLLKKETALKEQHDNVKATLKRHKDIFKL